MRKQKATSSTPRNTRGTKIEVVGSMVEVAQRGPRFLAQIRDPCATDRQMRCDLCRNMHPHNASQLARLILTVGGRSL